MSDKPTDAPAGGRRRVLLLAAVALGLYLLDLISKIIAVAQLSDRPPVRLFDGALYLTLTRNKGAAFGLGEGATILLTLVAVAVVVIIVRTARKLYSVGWAVSLGLILGGALGNLTDRIFRSPGIFRGGVVDFLSVFDPYGQVWPIFNAADSAIVVGGVLAMLLALTGREMNGVRTTKATPVQTAGASPAADQQHSAKP